jgi:alginate O-acetyltransferase complex protein AlgI
VIFSTIEFFLFFSIVLPAAMVLRESRWLHPFLLVASFYFYMSWNAWFILLLIPAIALDYYVAPKMAASTSLKQKRRWLMVSLVGNLGLLGFFKYTNFIIDTINVFVPARFQLAELNITLPIGISFHTFQTLSYTIDVFLGRVAVEQSFIKLALFVSFFPQLVAGPIVRAHEFLPQLYRRIDFDMGRIKEGLERFVVGLVKKLLIADALAPYVDRVYTNPALYDAPTLWLATFAFGIQIYCDFSGYSDMAIGTARCLGYRFPENFNMPYFATNIREFWQRWHISLSSWLRDYLYIPMGGSRGRELAVLRNLMVTMLLGGLWHGASWKFVIWGGLHGCFLIVYRLWWQRKKSRGWQSNELYRPALGVLSAIITFLAVHLAWVYFRANDAFTATTMIGRMMTWNLHGEFVGSPLLLIGAAVLLIGHLVATFTDPELLYRKVPMPFKVVGYAMIFYLISISSIQENTPFIYFQF